MTSPRVHVRHAGIQDLADSQSAAHARFESILGDIKSLVNQTLGVWYGDGTPEYRAKQQQFDNAYQDLQVAFANLQKATEGSHQQFTQASAKLRGIWA